MEYTKITCTLNEDNEIARELLMQELGDAGFESFVETDDGIEAYIPSVSFSPEILAAENLQKNEFFSFDHTLEVIADQNWNEVWEQNYFEPLLIEDLCVIRAPFHLKYPAAQYEIIIDPKMAFGTGNHETTHLMIKAILDLELNGKDVLDMGCGSGILAILAAMKGAAAITAIDIDEWSTNNTIENAELNHIGNILVRQGDANLLSDQQFDVILANIQRNILFQDMEAYRKVLKNGGLLIMSGFYTTDLEAIEERANSFELKMTGSYERSTWCAASFRL
ncbi:MAG: 50S ribosomal protein L11 methyltransferase [Bacteroidetes bacterium]|nr:MAG: 50S ribosomal protein L11 methyltransferase [Bacteroidota bacterium]